MKEQNNFYTKQLKQIKNQPHFSDKFGYLVFDYQKHINEQGYYTVKDVNIGDYIQSLAARQFLPSSVSCDGTAKDIAIDRDSIAGYDGEPVNMIMNSWYWVFDGNKTASDKINPLFVSFHINNAQDVTQETIDYLKKYAPIGCRDFQTRDFLLQKGVEAYFSGCLTTTLDEKYMADPSERTDEVLIVDPRWKNNIFSKKCKFYDKNYHAMKKILKNYRTAPDKTVTHRYAFGLTEQQYFEEAKKLLNRYARAKLVITTRIHAALPCLALGTPVILLVKKFDEKRYKGIADFLNIIGEDETGNTVVKVRFDEAGMVENPQNFKPYAENLKAICRAFVGHQVGF